MAKRSESYEDSLRRSFTRGAMEQRQGDRIALKLNAPTRGVRGLSNIVGAMCGRDVHPLACQCIECVPDSVRVWMVEHYGQDWDAKKPAKTGIEPLPVTKLPDQPAPKRRKKYNGRETLTPRPSEKEA